MPMRSSGFSCLVVLAGIIAQPALSQTSPPTPSKYPSKTLRLVVTNAPGGGASIMAHMVAQKLSPALGQNIVVDNRGGAGGIIGTNLVAKSQPDGYTLLFQSSAYCSIPYFHKNIPYDPLHDLVPVTLIGMNFGQVLVVSSSFSARSVKGLIALAKANPGKLDYGSTGVGGVLHLAAELFNMQANVKMNHVPYKGGADAMTAIIAGQVQVAFPAAHSTLAFIQSGRLRALGITSEERWSQLPDVPTLMEVGLSEYKFVGWYGLWFPAGTPASYVGHIYSTIANFVKDPEIKQRFAEQGLRGVGSSSAEFEKVIIDELALNKKLTTSIGIVPE